MIFGEELACFFPIIIHAGMSSVFTVLFFSAGCIRSLDSLRRIVVPDSFRYSFWTACTLGCAARSSFRQHFLHNLPRENLCFKLFTQSYSFSDMTVVSSGSPAGDIPNVSFVMFLTDFLLPF